ncbi:hypothetical protein BS017_RS16525 [Vibrio parahaemolyticus]|nr:hypothetical protein [Vibrio parahaemolyticus]EJG2001614.1 hypothetical protein [Vibrio parahaemolyticus]EJG2036895.1 hypothetical protein [Vibrio parahaemolyticus]EJG2043763.1 hypothetical protein [Vibrio parahaemolyticus]EJG2232146.1 hypothetical protein [Vibrio parahaemolyticus]
MNTSTKLELDNQLNELLEDAIKLSQYDNICDLYQKAESIQGLDFLLNSRDLKSTVLNQDAIYVLKWLENKIINLGDTDIKTTKAIFFFVGLVSNHSDFWSSSRGICDQSSKQLIEHSILILSSLSSNIHFDFMTNYHKEERKEHLNKIVSDNNWSKIYDEYHRNHDDYKHSICYSLKSAFTLLYNLDEKSLMSILDVKRDIPFIWGMMDLMGKSKAMNIALETTNQTLKFCALSSVLPFSGRDSLNEYENDKLAEVFLDFMKDGNIWQHWMKILNTYPSRYPHIQLSLGKALAQTTSDNAIQCYFKAIYLYTVDFHDIGRKSVGECLESFSKFASEEDQKLAWCFAYEIWDSWDFGVKDTDGHLFEIKASALDYAVTKYYLKCCDTEERKILIEKLYRRLNDIDNIWHQTSAKHTTYWYLQNSKFQPLYHAEEVSRNTSLPCLMQGKLYQNNYGEYEEYIQYMIN